MPSSSLEILFGVAKVGQIALLHEGQKDVQPTKGNVVSDADAHAQAAALSASLVNASAKNASGGSPAVATYAAWAESTTMGAPQA